MAAAGGELEAVAVATVIECRRATMATMKPPLACVTCPHEFVLDEPAAFIAFLPGGMPGTPRHIRALAFVRPAPAARARRKSKDVIEASRRHWPDLRAVTVSPEHKPDAGFSMPRPALQRRFLAAFSDRAADTSPWRVPHRFPSRRMSRRASSTVRGAPKSERSTATRSCGFKLAKIAK